MIGLSWDQIILILLAALFLLGPERIPTAVKWAMDSLRKVKGFAAGAQSEMRSQLGPELDELRRQVSELQSLKELKEFRDLKELKELRELRDLDPRRIMGKSLLGDDFSGGVKGFLGLNGKGPDEQAAAAAAAPTGTQTASGAASSEGVAAGAAGPTESATSADSQSASPPERPSPGVTRWADVDMT